MVSSNGDFRQQAAVWWERNTGKYPDLIRQYGQAVPLDADGKISSAVIAAVQQARLQATQAATPLVGEGKLLPGQRRVQAPKPVNWREVGRDITAGLGVVSEEGVSKIFGVEPRDFDIPEDAGILRKVADPLLPTLGAITTASERFLDPSAAAAWQLGGEAFTGTELGDPYGQVSARQALRQAGYGPMESITGAYEQADIPIQYKLPVEVLTSPDELLPGVGMYAGATKLLGRGLGRAVGRQAAEEVAPRIPTPTPPAPSPPPSPLVPMDQPAGPVPPLPQPPGPPPPIEPPPLGVSDSGAVPTIMGYPVQEVPGTPNSFVMQIEPAQLPDPADSEAMSALMGRTRYSPETETALAQAKNEGYPLPADEPRLSPAVPMDQPAGPVPPLPQPSPLGLAPISPTYEYELVKVMDTLDSTLRGILPADLARAADSRSNDWLNDKVGQELIVKYEGTLNSHTARIQDFSITGARKMEALGLGKRERGIAFGTERTFRLKEADWGTLANPGPVRFLYRALHGEVPGMTRAKVSSGMTKEQYDAAEKVNDVVAAEARRIWISGNGMAHPAMAAGEYEKRADILATLLRATKYEESMRIDFDPSIGRVQDYFDRGWKPAKDAEGKEIAPNVQALTSNPSYTKARSAATYLEMEESGFEPLFRNPFDQSVWSQQNGIKFRLQSELAHWLQSDKIGLGVHVEGEAALNKLNMNQFGQKKQVKWRIPRVGPAFEGKGYAVVEVASSEAKLQDMVEATTEVLARDKTTQKAVFKAGQIAVPSGVADKLESIFRGGGTTLAKTYNQTIPFTDKTVPVNIVKLIDAMVFIPKRLKLFGSLFQATDFARRLGVGGTHGVVDAVWSGIDRGQPFSEAFDAGRVAGEIRKSVQGTVQDGWWGMISSYGAAGKTDHYRNLLRSKATTGPNAVMEGTKISWDGLVKNGLNVRDLTILPGEDLAQMVDQVAKDANFAVQMGRHVKELEYSMRRGLFDRVYPAAIMTDVKSNLVPMATRMYPNASPDQIMALVARQANIKYSTLLRSQSEVNQFWREFLTRTMFSLNENEGLMRQMTRAMRGEEKAFWRKYWVSALLFFGVTANLIHAGTTTVTEGKPRFLPLDRFKPWRDTRVGWWKYGYNNQFFNPSIPWPPTRSGELAMVEMLGQLDGGFRMLDFQHIAGDSFVNARKGATAGAFMHLISGQDFYGRDTDKFGHSGRLLQFLFDIAAPIGFGEAGVGAIRKFAGDVDIPAVGSFIAPDAKLKDILPVDEATLSMKGMLFEATGENIRAPSSADLQRTMIQNFDPEEPIESVWDLPGEKRRDVLNYEGNLHLVDEIKLRTKEGAARDQVFSARLVERDEIKSSRMQQEHDLSAQFDKQAEKGAWEPTHWKNDNRNIQLVHRVRQDMVTQKYREDADIRRREEANKLSDKQVADLQKEKPLEWAYHKYYKLMEKHSEAFKKMDYDKFNAALKAEQATWGEALVLRWDADRAAQSAETHAPKVAQYYADMQTLEKVGWFTTPTMNTMVSTLAPATREAWEKWLRSGPMERRRLEGTQHGASIRTLKYQRGLARNAILMTPESGPIVDKIVVEWYGRNPAHRSSVELFYKLYGKMPSRMGQ